jgi:hypothetical protein
MYRSFESNTSREISSSKRNQPNENKFVYNNKFLNSSSLMSSSSSTSIFKIPLNQQPKIVYIKPKNLAISNYDNLKQSGCTINDSTTFRDSTFRTSNKKVPINILIYKNESTPHPTNVSQINENSYMKSVIHDWKKNLRKSSTNDIISRNIKLIKNKSQFLTDRKTLNLDIKLNVTNEFDKSKLNFSTLKTLKKVNSTNQLNNNTGIKILEKIYPNPNALEELKKNFMKKKVLKINDLREKLFNQPKKVYLGIAEDPKMKSKNKKSEIDSNFVKYKDSFVSHAHQSTKNIQSTFTNVFHLTNPLSYSKNFKSCQEAINIHNDHHIKNQIKNKLKSYKLAKKLAQEISLEIKKQMFELNHDKIKFFNCKIY